MVDNLGLLRQSALLEESNQRDFFQLSFNVYGIFIVPDLRYQVKHILGSKFMSLLNWSEGQSADLSCFSFSEYSDYEPIYFLKKDLHKKEFPIIKPQNKHTSPLYGLILIEHRPTHGNYWHFQFKVLDEQNDVPISKNKAQWQKSSINRFLELYFPMYFKTHIKEVVELDLKVYTSQ
jgi:hypothetical protein